jgi:hypothetical protein
MLYYAPLREVAAWAQMALASLVALSGPKKVSISGPTPSNGPHNGSCPRHINNSYVHLYIVNFAASDSCFLPLKVSEQLVLPFLHVSLSLFLQCIKYWAVPVSTYCKMYNTYSTVYGRHESYSLKNRHRWSAGVGTGSNSLLSSPC